MDEMKHEPGTHPKPHHMHGIRPWYSWKSPIGIGFFMATGALGLAIILYTLLNFFVSLSQLTQTQSSQGMSQQELQQLMQQSSSSQGASAGTAAPSSAQ